MYRKIMMFVDGKLRQERVVVLRSKSHEAIAVGGFVSVPLVRLVSFCCVCVRNRLLNTR